MLGSHDSFTYLKAKNPIYEIFSWLWRTQTKSIKEQAKIGVSYLDVRVHYNYEDYKWELCHGLVNFNKEYSLLSDILNEYKDFKVRLILEKGNEERFIKEFKDIKDYPNLDLVAIKKNWKVLKQTKYYIDDYSYIPFYSDLSFWNNIKRMNWFNTIKRWAKTHNPLITKKMINSSIVYFLDRV